MLAFYLNKYYSSYKYFIELLRSLTMNTIEIDNDVLDLLKKNADPFNDSPNSVLRRLLGLEGAKSNRSNKTNRGGRMQSDEFVKKIISHYYNYSGIPRKVGRYQYMFNLDGKLVYFQNFSKPTNNLWYRLKSSAIEKLKNKNSEIVFTYSVDGIFYPINVSELQQKLEKNNWSRDDIEVNIDPDSDYWRELNWRLDRHSLKG